VSGCGGAQEVDVYFGAGADAEDVEGGEVGLEGLAEVLEAGAVVGLFEFGEELVGGDFADGAAFGGVGDEGVAGGGFGGGRGGPPESVEGGVGFAGVFEAGAGGADGLEFGGVRLGVLWWHGERG
jgi:hypothetical protein